APVNARPQFSPARHTAHLFPVTIAILIVVVEAHNGVRGSAAAPVCIRAQMWLQPFHQISALLRGDDELHFKSIEPETHGIRWRLLNRKIAPPLSVRGTCNST